MGAGAGFGSAALTGGLTGVSAWSATAWGIGLISSSFSGAVGGFASQTFSQIMDNGFVIDWQSVGWSSLQGAGINILSMLTTSIGGGAGLSVIDSIGLNIIMGFPVSAISFTVDMLRYFVWGSKRRIKGKNGLKPSI